MSEFKDIVDTIVNLIGKIIPYFQKTEKDIQLFKELKEMADSDDDKKLCDENIRNLKVFQATKGSPFTYRSMMDLNKKYPAAQLHSYHLKFLSDQEHRLIEFHRDSEKNIVKVSSKFNMDDLNKKQFSCAKIMILGFFFMIFPELIYSAFFKIILTEYFPILAKFFAIRDVYYTILTCSVLVGIFFIIRSIRNVFDVYTLQELMIKGLVQEPLQNNTIQQTNSSDPTTVLPLPASSNIHVENNDH
ncbi:hypothetical protein KTH44_21380 [Acinetobacter bereziniae]|uniref:hypothetical protein n=2 Tax=Acinetobacter bereziniae TaxID=106648 RepID=UPI0021CD90DA|nr:hypothetical protein [Acinetobacter bereziniae]MCU4321658.1 hypothetical protein [Acinetobacter bereziniae]